MHHSLKYLLFLTVCMLPLLAALGVLRYRWTRPSPWRAACVNLTVLSWTSFVLVLLVEGIFYTAFIHSDSFGFTLAARRWKDLYWAPLNAQGYRDTEHTDLQGKQLLFVTGDSFVSGYGIKDYTQRFANVLGQKLGPKWEVFTIAQNGWNTQDEYDAVVASPHTPKTLILSYYLNDIENAVRKAGRTPPPLVPTLPPGLNFFVENSYAWNFVYWRLYRFASVTDLRATEVNSLQQAYRDESIWAVHQEELRQFIAWTSTRNIALVVLVFPNLHEVAYSAQYTAPVVDFFQREGVEVIDLVPLLTGREPSELIVNSFDAHPSVALHHEIGELLYTHLSQRTFRSPQTLPMHPVVSHEKHSAPLVFPLPLLAQADTQAEQPGY